MNKMIPMLVLAGIASTFSQAHREQIEKEVDLDAVLNEIDAQADSVEAEYGDDFAGLVRGGVAVLLELFPAAGKYNPAGTKPEAVGVYATRGYVNDPVMYQHWNGEFWGYYENTPGIAKRFAGDKSERQNPEWHTAPQPA
jgi:hypothetical protein